MGMRVKFRPKHRISRKVLDKGKVLVVFYPGTEYEGETWLDNTDVHCSCGKHPGTYILGRNEVNITKYL